MWLPILGRIVTLALGLLVPPLTAEAQQAMRVYRIGWLSAGPPPPTPTVQMQAFQEGLRDLGYVEGHNLVIAYRYGEGQAERLREVATELVQLPVDVIVAQGASGTRGAQRATRTIPIVMTGNYDPVGEGFVASLARPGGNITGMSNLRAALISKQLEFLKETVPQSRRIAVLANPASPGHMPLLHNLTVAAEALKLSVHVVEVRDVVGHLTSMAERFRGTVARAVRGDVSPPAGSSPVGTSTQAGRRAFVARQAIAYRERLGDQVFPTFRAQMDQFMAVLAQLGPQEWEQPAYSALRLVPLWTYPYLTLREIAIHAWDIRSRFDPAARLSVESVPALMQGLALQIGPPWDAAFGQEAGRSRPVRSRWAVTGVVPGRYDIVAENGMCRIEAASEAVADVTCRGEAETVVLVLYGRLTLEAARTTGRLGTEGEPGLVAAFARWLQGA